MNDMHAPREARSVERIAREHPEVDLIPVLQIDGVEHAAGTNRIENRLLVKVEPGPRKSP